MVKTANDRKSERTGSDCVLWIPPNEAGACVIATWRLGLRSPLVARHKIKIFLIQRWVKTRERWSPKLPMACQRMKAEKVVHCAITTWHDMIWQTGGKSSKTFAVLCQSSEHETLEENNSVLDSQGHTPTHTKLNKTTTTTKNTCWGVFRKPEAPATCVRTFYAMPDDSKDQTYFCQKMIVCTFSFNTYFALRAGQVLILLFF